MSRRRHRTAQVASRVLGPGSRRSARAGVLAALSVLAAIGAGCGSSQTATATRAASPAAPASPSGSTPASPPPTATATTAAAAALRTLHAQVVASLHAAARRHGHYGGLPSFLPRSHVAVGRTVVATPQRPALAIEGAAVRLALPQASTLATAVGPYVPGAVQGTGVRQTFTRFTVSLRRVRGRIPVSPRLFTIVDELGQVLHPRVTMAGRPIRGGSSVERSAVVTLTTVLPIGNGTLRYTPAGRHYLVAWDFDVETD